jgi:hypothetical protein
MKVGGTQRRLASAFDLGSFMARWAFSRRFSSTDFRVLDSGTLTPRWLSR